jgi:hypothetical protein
VPPMAGEGWSALETVRERASSQRRRRSRPRRCGVPMHYAEGAVQICLGVLCPVPRLRSEGRGFPERGHESIGTTACVARMAAPPRTRYASGHEHP